MVSEELILMESNANKFGIVEKQKKFNVAKFNKGQKKRKVRELLRNQFK